MFRAAKQNRIFQDVVDQIQENILAGKLKSGEILPGEKELQEIFGVSRGTMREAMRVLEQKGLVGIKPGAGGGAFVKGVPYGNVGESLELLIRHKKVSLQHLAEFRECVEGDMAALAAGRAGEEEITELKALLRELRRCLDGGTRKMDAFINTDKQIHLKLAFISQNPVYISLQQSIHDNIDRYFQAFLSMQTPELQENYDDLCRIVKAVEKGETELARRLARQHVLKFNHYMSEPNRPAEKTRVINKIVSSAKHAAMTMEE
jgi:DNA-binding FadR family transcriptional regulator